MSRRSSSAPRGSVLTLKFDCHQHLLHLARPAVLPGQSHHRHLLHLARPAGLLPCPRRHTAGSSRRPRVRRRRRPADRGYYHGSCAPPPCLRRATWAATQRGSGAAPARAAPSPERVTTGLPQPPTIQRTKCGEEHPRAATGLRGAPPHAFPVAVARPAPAHPALTDADLHSAGQVG